MFSVFGFDRRVRKRVVVVVIVVVVGVAVARVALLAGIVINLGLGTFQIGLLK